MNRVKTVIAGLFFLLAASVSAKSIGVQVIQQNFSLDTVHSSSYLVEDTVLNSFFDYGYVVTNSPVALSGSEDYETVKEKALKDAFEGQIEYLVILTVSYADSGSTNPTGDLLSNIDSITAEIINTITRETISSKKYTPAKATGKENSSEGIKKFASGISKDIFSVLKSVR